MIAIDRDWLPVDAVPQKECEKMMSSQFVDGHSSKYGTGDDHQREQPLMRGKLLGLLLFALATIAALVAMSCQGSDSTPSADADQIRVPPGFTVVRYLDGLEHPTDMTIGPDGRLYVTLQSGEIISSIDGDGDGVADDTFTYASDLVLPLGIAFVGEDLFVSQRGKVTQILDKDGDGLGDVQEDIVENLPVGGELHQNFQNNNIAVGPDGFLYVSIGIDLESGAGDHEDSGGHGGVGTNGTPEPGDSEGEERLGLGDQPVTLGTLDERSGTVIRFRPDGREEEIYAVGFKNPVGLAFDREGNLFATDNAPHIPNGPDELNHVVRGADYGYPNRPGDLNDSGTVPVVSQLEIAASAGLTFYYGDMFPPELFGNVFVAQWGQATVDVHNGNRVVRVILEIVDGNFRGVVRNFASGFEHPIKTVVGPDGSLYIADWGSLDPEDEGSGEIYRIFYAGS